MLTTIDNRDTLQDILKYNIKKLKAFFKCNICGTVWMILYM